MNPTKTRFAPSPTGLIHLGNARTALFSRLYGERFLLRIEDTDRERSREIFVGALMDDMRWLGLDWDEGPLGPKAESAYFQSERETIYADYYRLLEEAGLTYPCFCTTDELERSRKAQRSAGHPPRYMGPCASLPPERRAALQAGNHPFTLRFRVPKNETVAFTDAVRGPQRFASSDIGDFILRRADGSSAFFFSNAIDDALMGVTAVLRGEDHLSNTPRQILLLQALGLPVPEYGHLALILGDDGAPLSKRNGSRSIHELREEGYLPLAVLNLLGRLGHHYGVDQLLSLDEMRYGFNLAHLGKAPARFDPVQLKHWQEAAVRGAADETLWNWLHTDTHMLVPGNLRAEFLAVVRSNCLFPGDAHTWARILFTDTLERHPDVVALAQMAGEVFFRIAFDQAHRPEGTGEGFVQLVQSATGAKGKALFQPLRAALTGRLDGPELGRISTLLPPSRLRSRLAEFMGPAG